MKSLVQRLLAVMLVAVFLFTGAVACSTSASPSGSGSLSGTYKADGEADLDTVTFSGHNGIELRYGSWMDVPEKGTYTIQDGKLTAIVTYKDANGDSQTDTNTFSFERSGNTITLNSITYTKQ